MLDARTLLRNVRPTKSGCEGVIGALPQLARNGARIVYNGVADEATVSTDRLITHRFRVDDYGHALETMRRDGSAHTLVITP